MYCANPAAAIYEHRHIAGSSAGRNAKCEASIGRLLPSIARLRIDRRCEWLALMDLLRAIVACIQTFCMPGPPETALTDNAGSDLNLE